MLCVTGSSVTIYPHHNSIITIMYSIKVPVDTNHHYHHHSLHSGGETGVFDIEELVDLLKEDNAQDIVVIQVRKWLYRWEVCALYHPYFIPLPFFSIYFLFFTVTIIELPTFLIAVSAIHKWCLLFYLPNKSLSWYLRYLGTAHWAPYIVSTHPSVYVLSL